MLHAEVDACRGVVAPEYLPFQSGVPRRKRESRFLEVIEPWLTIEDGRRRLNDRWTTRAGGSNRATSHREEKTEQSCLTR